MAKLIVSSAKAREGLKRGIDILADTVKVTLGPSGRSVVVDDRYGSPHVTKDGVAVAKGIVLSDPIENVGAQLLKEASQQTGYNAGDGTTTATVLAQSMVSEGMKHTSDDDINTTSIRKGMELAGTIVCSFIKEHSVQVNVNTDAERIDTGNAISDDMNRLNQVATISANGDTFIGNIIAEAFKHVGIEGVVSVSEGTGVETMVEQMSGMQFDRGYLAPHFCTDLEKLSVEYQDAYILIVDKKISVMKDLVPVLEKVRANGKPLLILAEDVDGEAISSLVVNKLQNILRVVAVKAPWYGERRKALLQDIAIVTGAIVISDETNVDLFMAGPASLGTVGSLLVTKDKTVISGGGGDKEQINNRIAQLRAQIESTQSNFDKDTLRERLAKLSNGVAMIKIGATTEVEMKEKKDRIDDALHATRAAIEEGTIPGGGTIYIKAIHKLEEAIKLESDDNIVRGLKIVKKALTAPAYYISKNAGFSGDVVVDKISSDKRISHGFDAKNNVFGDMYEAGVIDPAKVARLALSSAISVASMILTTDSVITDIPDAKSKEPGQGMMEQ